MAEKLLLVVCTSPHHETKTFRIGLSLNFKLGRGHPGGPNARRSSDTLDYHSEETGKEQGDRRNEARQNIG